LVKALACRPVRISTAAVAVGMWESRGLSGISKGGGKRGKPVLGFSTLSMARHFHS
jgi:hypothetical protein